ncbi:2Fe-2S iron-sulfur cluster-binding protein [Pseudonocardia acaciae]|uniref:2Fe-2S iron-sulfur cluster-binding protein n=1 Tax=Pseudonocardia acaciae TaxID=551276 RepID=UPI0014703700|nr:2Fe-2S iron-sulfur cluster-binding protein [Pseudonocardia acaciae]
MASLALFAVIATLAAFVGGFDAPGLEPAAWRFVTCTSGSLALGLLGLATFGGIALRGGLSDEVARRFGGKARLNKAHMVIAVFGVVLTLVHVTSACAVAELGIGWLQLFVPFTRVGGPLAQGLGVFAEYLLLAVLITSALRRRLPWKWWQRVHMLAVPLFGLAVAHTVLAESWATPMFTPAAMSASALLLTVPVLHWRARRSLPRPVAAAPTPAQRASTRQLSLLISQMTWEAEGIMSLRLVAPNGVALPPWSPGAHIEVALPSGRVRNYSLYGDPRDRYCYRIAVLRQDAGQGGSQEMHELLRVGRKLPVGLPRNAFPLRPAPSYLFLAGGIGITAMLPMARAIAGRGIPWRLIYSGRSRQRMALIDAVLDVDRDRVRILPEDERGRPDLATLIKVQLPGTAVYCCGPPSMVERVTELVGDRPDLSLHVERFSPALVDGEPFHVDLRRSGCSVKVGGQQSVLDAVRHVVPKVAGGCEQGICGRCKATVISGVPDHRDSLLSAEEREGGQMLLCVSRARSERLTLDL